MDETWVTLPSRYAYDETLSRLLGTINAAAGNQVFAVVDQAQAAREVGLDLRPTALIVFGNPKGGTPLMAEHPAIALELPLKLLIWDDGTAVQVAHPRMAAIVQRYGIDPADPRIVAMDRALDTLTASVTM
jgi:uncharacterized protein (DUF302 family)